MHESDKLAFKELLEEHFGIYGTPCSKPVMRKYWDHLRKYSLSDVTEALRRHELDPSEGKFVAKPAHIVGILEAARPNARPDVEEAWSIAVRSFDEANSALLNEEISEARAAAQPIMALGDEVGARMAFKSVYTKTVAVAEANGIPPRWWVSVGMDKDDKKQVVQEAVRLGRLPAKALDEFKALPGPDLLRLESDSKAERKPGGFTDALAKIAALREAAGLK